MSDATKRLLTDGRFLYHFNYVSLHKAFAFTRKLHVYNVSGNALRYKENLSVYMSKAITLSGNGLNAHIFNDYLLLISLSAHLRMQQSVPCCCKRLHRSRF